MDTKKVYIRKARHLRYTHSHSLSHSQFVTLLSPLSLGRSVMFTSALDCNRAPTAWEFLGSPWHSDQSLGLTQGVTGWRDTGCSLSFSLTFTNRAQDIVTTRGKRRQRLWNEQWHDNTEHNAVNFKLIHVTRQDGGDTSVFMRWRFIFIT